MNDWLQSLAVGLAVLVGLVTPPSQLQLESQAFRRSGTVWVQAEVAGALTPQVRDYVLAGNSVTLRWRVRWGDSRRELTSTFTYHAWEDRYEVSGAGDSQNLADRDAAVAAWAVLPSVALGEQTELEANLGTALTVTVELIEPSGSLWGYRTLESQLLYRSWLEVPR